MKSTGIVRQMEDYFSRHAAWLESVRKEINRLTEEFDEDGILNALVKQNRNQVEQLSEFEVEFKRLEQEWRSTQNLTEEERARIRQRAREVAAFADEVAGLFEKAGLHARTKSSKIKQTMDQIRRGRDVMNKYALNPIQAARFIDKNG